MYRSISLFIYQSISILSIYPPVYVCTVFIYLPVCKSSNQFDYLFPSIYLPVPFFVHLLLSVSFFSLINSPPKVFYSLPGPRRASLNRPSWNRSFCFFGENTNLTFNSSVYFLRGGSVPSGAGHVREASGLPRLWRGCRGSLIPSRRPVLEEASDPVRRSEEADRQNMRDFDSVMN